METLPPLPPPPTLDTIRERLSRVFSAGTPNRNYCIRDMAVSTVFVMLYVGAVAERDRWVRPDQITRMSDEQAARTSREERLGWCEESLRPGGGQYADQWYAANTREPIRDETIRSGFIPLGAVKERAGLPTTSPRPRYALTASFAALFDPDLEGKILTESIRNWQSQNLTAGARARVQILRHAAVETEEGVLVEFPNQETRRMAPGPSSIISKAVIEDFATGFLEKPGVVFLSESRNKVVARDDRLAQTIGLTIEPDRHLPDIILVDLGPPSPLLVFVEVVATSGSIDRQRREALLGYAIDAGYEPAHIAFVTAYKDRNDSAFKRTVPVLAWQSFAWFMSEPHYIIHLRQKPEEQTSHLAELLM